MIKTRHGWSTFLLVASFSAFAAEQAPTPPPGPSVAAPSPRRLAIRTRTAVMGVRGLDEVDLKDAKPDEAALARLDAFRPTAAELEAFPRFRKWTLKPVADGNVLKFKPADLKDETEIGHEMAATLLGAAPLVDDERVQKYVNLVGSWVAQRSDRPDLPWRFAVLASDSINAFAVPGGYVFVTAGLYQKARSEAALAGVLGHEITHVVSRDHYNAYIVSRTIARATDSIKRMMANNPAFKNVVAGASEHATLVFTAALDQNAETNADRQGMMLAADAGYEPYGLPEVIKVLALVSHDDAKAALLFKTHPSPDERLAAVRDVAPVRFAAKAKDPSMKARFDEYDLASMKLIRRVPAKK